MSHDPVNHPAHYTAGSIEAIDAIRAALGDDATPADAGATCGCGAQAMGGGVTVCAACLMAGQEADDPPRPCERPGCGRDIGHGPGPLCNGCEMQDQWDEADRERTAADAERYRFLRDHGGRVVRHGDAWWACMIGSFLSPKMAHGATAEAAVDAMRAKVAAKAAKAA